MESPTPPPPVIFQLFQRLKRKVLSLLPLDRTRDQHVYTVMLLSRRAGPVSDTVVDHPHFLLPAASPIGIQQSARGEQKAIRQAIAAAIRARQEADAVFPAEFADMPNVRQAQASGEKRAEKYDARVAVNHVESAAQPLCQPSGTPPVAQMQQRKFSIAQRFCVCLGKAEAMIGSAKRFHAQPLRKGAQSALPVAGKKHGQANVRALLRDTAHERHQRLLRAAGRFATVGNDQHAHLSRSS